MSRRSMAEHLGDYLMQFTNTQGWTAERVETGRFILHKDPGILAPAGGKKGRRYVADLRGYAHHRLTPERRYAHEFTEKTLIDAVDFGRLFAITVPRFHILTMRMSAHDENARALAYHIISSRYDP